MVDIGAVAAVVGGFWLGNVGRTGGGLRLAGGVALVLLVSAAMLLRWRFPVAAPVVALVVTGTGWILEVGDDPMLAVAWCLYPLALRRGGRSWSIGAGAVGVMVLLSTMYGGPTTGGPAQRIAYACIAIGVSWLLGHVEAGRLERVRDAGRQYAETLRAKQQALVSREVHDVVGHALGVIRAEADVALNLRDVTEDELRQTLADIQQRAGSALKEVQGLVRALRSGSPAAIVSVSQLVAAARVAGLEVETHLDIPEAGPEVEAVVSRVAQEALSNVIRHAQARRCEVAVWQEENAVSIRIDDDGVGVEPTVETGMGLAGMRERVEENGGSLVVSRRLQGGTRVLAKIPMAGRS